MNFVRRGLAAAASAATAAAMLVGVPQTAQAATTVAWTHTHNWTTRIISSSAGVTTGSCMTPYGNTVPAATTYAANGDTVGTVTELEPNLEACDWMEPMLVDKAGNSFIAAGGSRSWNHVPKIYSFTKAGVSRWTQPATLPQACASDNADRFLDSRVIGADGNLYGILLDYCEDGPKFRLVGFNSHNGTLRFNRELPWHEVIDFSMMGAHRNGLAVYYKTGIRHFNYAGDWVSTAWYRQPLTSTLFTFQGRNSQTVGVGGNALMLTATYGDDECGGSNYRLKSLDSYRTWGLEWQADLKNLCVMSARVDVTPDGGAVLYATVRSTHNPLGYDTAIHRFNNNGQHERVRWTATLPAMGLGQQYHFEQDKFVGVDTNGNVLVERFYANDLNGGPWSHFQIVKLADKTGAQTIIADTAQSGKEGSFYNLHANVATGNGQVYAAYGRSCDDAPEGSDCNTRPMLFAFSAPGIGYDYPRGALFNTEPVKNSASFQALGDSYISGEGDDQQGFVVSRGRCHVSNTAWPMRISGDTRLNLMLSSFPACSGAKATQMVNGGDGQAKQVDKLQSGAKAYAVSAGGNDVGFTRLIASCILLDCGAVEDEIMGKINNLGNQLNPLYDKIKQKSGTTGDVYVMGYPRVVPNSQCSVASVGVEALSQIFINPAYKSAVTEWLAGIEVSADDYADALAARNFTFSANEAAAATRITNALNAKIEALVTARNDPKFHFVKANYSGGPFEGKTLCSSNPVFNGIVVTYSDPSAIVSNLALSFHPNNAGTAAYKQMFVDCRLNKKNCT